MIGFRGFLSVFLLSVIVSTLAVLSYLFSSFLKGGLGEGSFVISIFIFLFFFFVSYLGLLLAIKFGGERNG